MSADTYTTYQLKFPVEYGDEVITELKIRRAKGKHLRGLTIDALDSVDVQMGLLASMSGQPPQVIDALDAVDVFAGLEVVGDFLSKTLPASKKSPAP